MKSSAASILPGVLSLGPICGRHGDSLIDTGRLEGSITCAGGATEGAVYQTVVSPLTSPQFEVESADNYFGGNEAWHVRDARIPGRMTDDFATWKAGLSLKHPLHLSSPPSRRALRQD